MVGEPETARVVEHEVVGRPQRLAVALGVERRHLAGVEVDALDRAVAPPGFGDGAGQNDRAEVDEVEAATVVGDVHRAVGAERGTVRPASALGQDL